MSDSGFVAALRPRLRPLSLSVDEAAIQAFNRFYELLAKWNQRINLTALPLGPSPPTESVDRLFVEPIVASQLIPDRRLTVVDLGSGAGSPAVILKILRPAIDLTMVESRGRKVAFLREVVRTLGLRDTRIEAVRFEMLAHEGPLADLVTIRAVRVDAELMATISRILSQTGELMVFGLAAPRPEGYERVSQLPLPDGSTVSVYRRQDASSIG